MEFDREMLPPPSMYETLVQICRELNARMVEYLVAGGNAVAAHGYPRGTNDIDMVVGLKPANLEQAMSALQELGYASQHAPVPVKEFCSPAFREMCRTEKGAQVFSFFDPNDPRRLTVDVFLTEPFDFDAEYTAAEHIDLADGVSMPVVRLETLIAMKRSAGRPKDLLDVAELLAANPRIGLPDSGPSRKNRSLEYPI